MPSSFPLDTLLVAPTEFSEPVVSDYAPAFGRERPTVLVVSDEPRERETLHRQLEEFGCSRIVSVMDSAHSIQIAARENPDLVLVRFSDALGARFLAELRVHPELSRTPVIAVCAAEDRSQKLRALELGVMDILVAPVDPAELVPRVRNVLRSRAYERRITRYAEELEQAVRQRTFELELSWYELIKCMARAAEFRDDITGHHVERVGRYSAIIAEELGCPSEYVTFIDHAAQLHDVGKIGIPDSILNKPGKLDSDEFMLMKTHVGMGSSILEPLTSTDVERVGRISRTAADLPTTRKSPLLEFAARIAQTHHEWWNGKGYPRGLKGEQIPLEGRITAIADVFDALSSVRTYKDAYPFEKCVEILEQGRGTQFDPRVLDAFIRASEKVRQVMAYRSDEAVAV